MLTGRSSISYYSPANIAIWMVLAFQAGTLNVGGFLACHRFVSHVTGFATFFGIEMVEADYQQAWGMLLVPVFFLLGSILSGYLVDIRLTQQKKPMYHTSFGVIFVLVLVVLIGGTQGYFGVFGEPFDHTRDYVLLCILCFTCGIQNGTVTTVSQSVVRTTHLTGITTDLGIGIARVLYSDKLPGQAEGEGHANWMRIGLILFFCIGSLTGAIFFQTQGYRGFLVPALTSGAIFFVTLYLQKPLRAQGPSHPSGNSPSA